MLPLSAFPPAHTLATTTQVIQLYLMRFVMLPELWDARHPWREITGSALGSTESFDALLKQLRGELDTHRHPFDVWLEKPLFTAFYDWYSTCKRLLDPEVKGWLARRLPGQDVVEELVRRWSLETRGYRLG